MGKMRIKTFAIMIAAIILWLAFAAPSCDISCKDYYWDYDCDWVSNDPEIELYKGIVNGRMVIDGKEYKFNTYESNNATYIGFCIDDEDLWVADTELKDGKLYLTITTDNISDYVGKTIILYQRPVQSEEPTN